MEDFNRLLEKLEAYKKLEDIVNKRSTVDLLISEYPDHIESWYEKASLLTGNFCENMVASQEFLKCMSNIEKLAGQDNKYYKECAAFYEKVQSIEEEKKKKEEEQALLNSELQKQKKEAQKRVIIKTLPVVLAVLAAVAAVWFITFPYFTRTIFSSEEEMEAKINGSYKYDNSYTFSDGVTVENYTKLTISNGTLTKTYVRHGEVDFEWDETIVKYSPKRGYFKTGAFKYIVDKNGSIIEDGQTFTKSH